MASEFLKQSTEFLLFSFDSRNFTDTAYEFRKTQKGRNECSYAEYNDYDRCLRCRAHPCFDSALGYCLKHHQSHEFTDMQVMIQQAVSVSDENKSNFSTLRKKRKAETSEPIQEINGFTEKKQCNHLQLDNTIINEKKEDFTPIPNVINLADEYDEFSYSSDDEEETMLSKIDQLDVTRIIGKPGCYSFIGKTNTGKTRSLQFLLKNAFFNASTVTVYSPVYATRKNWRRFFEYGFSNDIVCCSSKKDLITRLESIKKKPKRKNMVIFDDFMSEYKSKGVKNIVDGLYTDCRHSNIWAFCLFQKINNLRDISLLENSTNFVFKSQSRKYIQTHLYEKIFSMMDALPEDEKDAKNYLVSLIKELKKGESLVTLENEDGDSDLYKFTVSL